jgi:hypothetical protein
MHLLSVILFIFSIVQTSNPLEKYTWKNRILIIHEAGNTTHVQEALNYIDETRSEWEDRNMILVHIRKDAAWIDSNPLSEKEVAYLQSKYPAKDRNRFLLVGKDGGVKLDKYDKLSILEVYQLIDQMPMRRSEMRRKEGN